MIKIDFRIDMINYITIHDRKSSNRVNQKQSRLKHF